jgi:hypothetical protein
LHATGRIQSTLEIDALDQHDDGIFLAAFDLFRASAGTLSALEAVELRCVLLDVLGHQQHVAVLLDDEGITPSASGCGHYPPRSALSRR